VHETVDPEASLNPTTAANVSDRDTEEPHEVDFPQEAALTAALSTVALKSDPVALKSHYHHLPLLAESDGRVPFFGRKRYLQNMAASLESQSAKENNHSLSAAFAITGPAGQGKTQTAHMFASQHKTSFQYILWVTADQELKPLQAFQDYAVSIDLIASPSTDPWHDVNTLKEWFQKQVGP